MDVVCDNIGLLSKNEELGKTIIWLFSVEAMLRECVRILSELTTLREYKKLSPHILSRPTISRSRKDIKKYSDKNRLYYAEIDSATFGRLVSYYKQLRPNSKKLYQKLAKIKDGRNKIAHELLRSKDVEATFSKLFPNNIKIKPMKDIFTEILNDIRVVMQQGTK